MLTHGPGTNIDPMIDKNTLQLGDLIFFINHYYREGATFNTPPEERYDPDREPYVDHVAMYAGKNSDNFHLLIHSISPTEESRRDLSKPSGLCSTTLRPLLNQQEEDDPNIRYDVIFQAARFNNPDVTVQAFAYMKKWSQYRIPYDEKRLDQKLQKEKDWTTQQFLQAAEESYEKGAGLYRAAKFAARREVSLTLSKKADSGRGVTCSMIITLAFQVAELAPFVTAISKKKIWVSDKHGVQNSKADDKYMRYLEEIGNTSNNKNKKIICSNFYWKEDLSNFRHTSFRFDSKIIGAAGIYQYVQNNPSEWLQLGAVVVPSPEFSEDSKIRYKSDTVKNAVASTYNTNSTRILSRSDTPPKTLSSPQLTTTPDRFKSFNQKRPAIEAHTPLKNKENVNELIQSTENRSPSKPSSAIQELQDKIPSTPVFFKKSERMTRVDSSPNAPQKFPNIEG